MSRTIVFAGKSGERYHFNVWPIGTTFKAVAAVFVVTKRTLNDRTFTTRGSHAPVMIGQTEDLASAFLTDAQLKSLSSKGADFICLYAVKDPVERTRVEQDLIDGYEQAGGMLRWLVEPTAPQQKPGGVLS